MYTWWKIAFYSIFGRKIAFSLKRAKGLEAHWNINIKDTEAIFGEKHPYRVLSSKPSSLFIFSTLQGQGGGKRVTELPLPHNPDFHKIYEKCPNWQDNSYRRMVFVSRYGFWIPRKWLAPFVTLFDLIWSHLFKMAAKSMIKPRTISWSSTDKFCFVLETY